MIRNNTGHKNLGGFLKKITIVTLLVLFLLSSNAFAGCAIPALKEGLLSSQREEKIRTALKNSSIASSDNPYWFSPNPSYIDARNISGFKCFTDKSDFAETTSNIFLFLNQNGKSNYIEFARFGFGTFCGDGMDECEKMKSNLEALVSQAKQKHQYISMNLDVNDVKDVITVPTTVYLPTQNLVKK